MPGYYDVVLGLIPLALVGITGVLSLTGMALSVAIPIAGLVSIALIGHAMFVRTPAAPATAKQADSSGFKPAD